MLQWVLVAGIDSKCLGDDGFDLLVRDRPRSTRPGLVEQAFQSIHSKTLSPFSGTAGSTPLVAIRTADPALTVARIEEAVGRDAAIVQWDIVRGLVRVNDAGTKEIGKVLGERESASVGPVDALVAACQSERRRRTGVCQRTALLERSPSGASDLEFA